MDSVLTRVAKNTGIIIAGKIAYYGLAVIANLLLMRYLGSLRLGKLSIVYAYLVFFEILTWSGVDRVVVREVARDRARAGLLLGNAFMFRLLMCSVGVFSSLLILQLIGYPPDIKLFIYIASLGLFLRSGSLFETAYKVELRMALPMIVDVVSKVAYSACLIVLIALKARLVHFIVLNLLFAVPAPVIKWYFSRRIIHLDFHFDPALWRELLGESWPLMLSAVFVTVYTRIDQLMLFLMLDVTAVGLYSAPVRLTESMSIIPAAFMISVFPLISRSFKESSEAFRRAYSLSFRYLLILIVPVAMAFSVLSREIIVLLIGEQYLPSARVFAVLAWSEVFVFVGSVSGPVLLAMHLQRLDMLFTLGMAVLNVFLNLFFIPRMGIAGAAWATTISYGVPLLVGVFIPAVRAIAVTAIKSMVRPLIAAVVMGLCVAWLKPHASIFLIIPVGAFVYLAALMAVGGLTPDDARMFRSIISRKA